MTLGVGGATGEGTAANAGYQGKPGTEMELVSCSQAPPKPAAMLCVSFNASGLWHGPRARIRGIHAGPTTLPPEAVTALMVTPTKLAAARHVAHAKQMAAET